jgi:hypothetical protein
MPAGELGDQQSAGPCIHGKLLIDGLARHRPYIASEPIDGRGPERVGHPLGGVVHQDVDRAEEALRNIEQPGGCLSLAKIGLHCVCTTPGRSYLPDYLVRIGRPIAPVRVWDASVGNILQRQVRDQDCSSRARQ